MHAVDQARRSSITAALRHTCLGAYLATVAFVGLSAEGLQARAAETALALIPAVVVLAGLWCYRFVRRLRDLEPRERRRPLLFSGAVVLAVLIVLAGIWIYVESQPPPPTVELFFDGLPPIAE
jgi:4-hydroxybenzoate polyprenyltransferase